MRREKSIEWQLAFYYAHGRNDEYLVRNEVSPVSLTSFANRFCKGELRNMGVLYQEMLEEASDNY